MFCKFVADAMESSCALKIRLNLNAAGGVVDHLLQDVKNMQGISFAFELGPRLCIGYNGPLLVVLGAQYASN